MALLTLPYVIIRNSVVICIQKFISGIDGIICYSFN